MIKVNLTLEEIDLLEQCIRYFKSDVILSAKTKDDEDFVERLNLLLLKFDKLLEHV